MKISQLGVRITDVSGIDAIEVEPSDIGESVEIKVRLPFNEGVPLTFPLSRFQEIVAAFNAALTEARRIAEAPPAAAVADPDMVDAEEEIAHLRAEVEQLRAAAAAATPAQLATVAAKLRAWSARSLAATVAAKLRADQATPCALGRGAAPVDGCPCVNCSLARPVEPSCQGAPESVEDGSGDIWYRAPNGFYTLHHASHPEHKNACHSLEWVRAEYGIREER